MTTKSQQLRAKMETRIRDAIAKFYYEELPNGNHVTTRGIEHTYRYEHGRLYLMGVGDRLDLMASLGEDNLKNFSDETLLVFIQSLPKFYANLKKAQEEFHKNIEDALKATKEFEKPPGPAGPPRPVADRVG